MIAGILFDRRFAVNCITAAFLALLTSLRWETESEDEELEHISKMKLD